MKRLEASIAMRLWRRLEESSGVDSYIFPHPSSPSQNHTLHPLSPSPSKSSIHPPPFRPSYYPTQRSPPHSAPKHHQIHTEHPISFPPLSLYRLQLTPVHISSSLPIFFCVFWLCLHTIPKLIISMGVNLQLHSEADLERGKGEIALGWGVEANELGQGPTIR